MTDADTRPVPTTTSPTMTTTTPFLDPNEDVVDIKDFTIQRKRIRFRIDDDVFEAHTVLGVPLMQRLVQISRGIGNLETMEKFDSVYDIFDKLLLPESATRFRARATSEGEDGIDAQRQLIPILYHLLEAYGLRPTQPSSGSSPG